MRQKTAPGDFDDLPEHLLFALHRAPIAVGFQVGVPNDALTPAPQVRWAQITGGCLIATPIGSNGRKRCLRWRLEPPSAEPPDKRSIVLETPSASS